MDFFPYNLDYKMVLNGLKVVRAFPSYVFGQHFSIVLVDVSFIVGVHPLPRWCLRLGCIGLGSTFFVAFGHILCHVGDSSFVESIVWPRLGPFVPLEGESLNFPRPSIGFLSNISLHLGCNITSESFSFHLLRNSTSSSSAVG